MYENVMNFGVVVQLTILQQFCRYDMYEQRRNLQVCADLCKFFVAQLTILRLQYFPLFVFSFGIDIALT